MFTRFKSLAQLGRLPKYDDDSAKACLYGKLFVALLVEQLIHHARAILAWGYDVPAPAPPEPVARLQVHARPGRAHHRTAAPVGAPVQ